MFHLENASRKTKSSVSSVYRSINNRRLNIGTVHWYAFYARDTSLIHYCCSYSLNKSLNKPFRVSKVGRSEKNTLKLREIPAGSCGRIPAHLFSRPLSLTLKFASGRECVNGNIISEGKNRARIGRRIAG